MLTKIILHGGNSSKESPDNNLFFQEFTKGQKQDLRILLCYWARQEKEWKTLFKRDSQKIARLAQDKKLTFTLADDPLKIAEQLRDADCLYIGGGEFTLLSQFVQRVPNFTDLVLGKTIAGSSAGAFLICKWSINSFEWQKKEIFSGVGLLPISVLCHADIDPLLVDKTKILLQHHPKEPIVTLDECKYVVFYR